MNVVVIYMKSFVSDPLAATSNKEIIHQDFNTILPQYYIYSLKIYRADPIFQPHNNVSPDL